MLVSLNLKPDYKYVDGHNRVMFRLKRKSMNQLAVLGLVIVAAIATGLLGMLLPGPVREGLLAGILQPLYSTFFKVLTCVAGPMIFLSVAWGIYGIGDVDTLGRIGKRLLIRFLRNVFVAVCFAATLVAAFVLIMLVSLRRKVSPLLVIRKVSGPFMIALATASSAAAFSTSIDTCEHKFGVDESLAGFGFPLGMVMNRPIVAIYYLLMVFFFAAEYGVSCSPAWLIMAVFVCGVLTVSTPPVPGGSAVVFTMMFAQMGIPAEALALALAMDVIIDFYTTAFEQVAHHMTLINSAADLDMIDLGTLRSPQ